AAPRARLVLDGNGALTPEAAASLVLAVGRERVSLLEQPTPAGDDDALRRAGELSLVPVAADESARSAADVVRLARTGAAQVVNVKITKTGFAEALDMIAAARAGGLGLMIGGMVETELAMSASACLAAGQGGFAFVDLDTPLFMKSRPLSGGFTQRGPHLDLAGIALGHGVTPAPGLLR
ncbi:MAG: dipeptide epimerase, partial [Deltaproteobacteria bacterium]|nr:dipeptide epimerase [Deltaproteobacteria bacterium]